MISLLAAACQPLTGAVVITEWMYSGNNGEFMEFTNTGTTAVDMAGWSYSDNAETPGEVDLSGFGTLAPGESAILTETEVSAFRTAWTLDSSVKVIGSNTVKLGRSDEINLYDSLDALVDRLTYDDENISDSIRTQNVSGITAPTNYQANDVTQWTLTVNGVGDATTSTDGDVGSPGIAAIPETSAALLGLLGGLCLFRRSR